jgi:hypothetical protein
MKNRLFSKQLQHCIVLIRLQACLIKSKILRGFIMYMGMSTMSFWCFNECLLLKSLFSGCFSSVLHLHNITRKLRSLKNLIIPYGSMGLDLFVYLFNCTNLNLFFLFIIFSLFIYSYVYALFGPFLPPAPYPLLLPSSPLLPRQNLFCPFLQFCWRIDISNNKKDIAFLLVEIRIAIQRDS